MKMINTLKQKFTLGNLLAITFSIILAFILRHTCLYFFNYFPVIDNLGLFDFGFFFILALFRVVFITLFEYLLDDKFHTPLFSHDVNVCEIKKETNILNMVNSDSNNPSTKSSSPKSSSSESFSQLEQTEVEKKFLAKYPNFLDNVDRTPTPHDKAVDAIWDKMKDVLNEQENTIRKLYKIKGDNDLKFHDEDGSLSFSAPITMSDAEAERLSKQIGKLDRGLQNKILEYKNLCKKDGTINESMWTEVNKSIFDVNQNHYKKLFDDNEKKK